MTIIVQARVLSGIYKLVSTLNGEIAIAASTGLYFCKYDPVYKKFDLKQEFLLQEYIITAVYEVAPGHFFCGIWEHAFGVICAQGTPSNKSIKIQMPNQNETQCTDVIAVPDFDYKQNPFLFTRTNNAISLVDIGCHKVYLLCKVKNQKSSYEKMKLYKESNGDYRLMLSNRTGAVQEIKISRTFFVDLRHIAAK